MFSNDPFKNHTGRTEPTNRQFLTYEEVKKLEEVKLNNRESFIRDMFLFMAYTSLSYGDLFNLTPSHFSVFENNIRFIQIIRGKTNTKQNIPLYAKTEKIIEKYSNHPESLNSGKLFPSISNNKMNKNLKKIAIKAGITKPLTSDIARHTFAVISIENDVHIETVSNVMGHTSIRTTQIYAKITRNKVEKDFIKASAFLKSIFGYVTLIFIVNKEMKQEITKEYLENLKTEILEEVRNLVKALRVLPVVLKSKEVKKVLSCSDSKLESLRNKGLLPSTYVDGTYYYKKEDVLTLVGLE